MSLPSKINFAVGRLSKIPPNNAPDDQENARDLSIHRIILESAQSRSMVLGHYAATHSPPAYFLLGFDHSCAFALCLNRAQRSPLQKHPSVAPFPSSGWRLLTALCLLIGLLRLPFFRYPRASFIRYMKGGIGSILTVASCVRSRF